MHGFGGDARLKDSGEFRRVYARGRKTAAPGMLLWHLPGAGAGPARLGLSVSSKVGGAVRRNRLKRLLRETFRLHRARLPAGADIVASPRPGCPWKTQADAEREFLSSCRRAGLLPS